MSRRWRPCPATAAGLGADAAARAWLLSAMPVGLAAGHCWRRGCSVTTSAGGACTSRGSASLASRFVGLRRGPGDSLSSWPHASSEGVGGAAILACGLAILAQRLSRRGRDAGVHATAVWGARRSGSGSSLGVVVSALLGLVPSWRKTPTWLSVGAMALILVVAHRVPHHASRRAANRRRLDVPGLALFATAMTLIVCALTRGRDGVTACSPSVLATSTPCWRWSVFVVVERRNTEIR